VRTNVDDPREPKAELQCIKSGGGMGSDTYARTHERGRTSVQLAHRWRACNTGGALMMSCTEHLKLAQKLTAHIGYTVGGGQPPLQESCHLKILPYRGYTVMCVRIVKVHQSALKYSKVHTRTPLHSTPPTRESAIQEAPKLPMGLF